jgi:hypothetical protein
MSWLHFSTELIFFEFSIFFNLLLSLEDVGQDDGTVAGTDVTRFKMEVSKYNSFFCPIVDSALLSTCPNPYVKVKCSDYTPGSIIIFNVIDVSKLAYIKNICIIFQTSYFTIAWYVALIVNMLLCIEASAA